MVLTLNKTHSARSTIPVGRSMLPRKNLVQNLVTPWDPRLLTGLRKDSYGNFDAQLVEQPCGVSAGTGKLTFSDLTGVTILSSGGTSTPTKNGNYIEFSAGTIWNLKLSDGTWVPNPYDGYDVSGNCLHPDSRVMTGRGLIKAKDIIWGDTIYQEDGKFHQLQGIIVSERRKEIMISIKARLVPEIKLTPEHRVLRVDRDEIIAYRKNKLRYARRGKIDEKPKVSLTPKWTEARNLNIYDYLVLPKPTCFGVKKQIIKPLGDDSLRKKVYRDIRIGLTARDITKNMGLKSSNKIYKAIYRYAAYLNNAEFSYDKIVNESIFVDEELAELFGWYLAEGSTAKKSGAIVFSLGHKEINESKRIKYLLWNKLGLKSNISIKHSSSRIKCSNVEFRDFLIREFGRGSRNKKIPEFIMNSPINIAIAFLRAYINGDGCITEGDGQGYVDIVTTSKKIVADLILLFEKIGVVPSVYYKKKNGGGIVNSKIIKSGDCWSVRLLGQASLLFIDNRYQHTPEKYFEDDNNFYIPVTKIIKEEYSGILYDFTTQTHTIGLPFIIHNSTHGTPTAITKDTQDVFAYYQKYGFDRYIEKANPDNINDVPKTITGGTIDVSATYPSGTYDHISYPAGGILPKGAIDFDPTYGIWWDESTSTPRCGRTGRLAQYNADGLGDARSGMNNNLFSVQNRMRRCVVADNGSVAYYLDAVDSTKKADGSAAVLDGTDGQVMVEIPQFYYKYEKIGTKVYYSISLRSFSGSMKLEKTYIGAYEAWTDGSDMYSICDGSKKAITAQTRATYRTKAANRGIGWHQYSNNNMMSLFLLYITEYANFNTQDQISVGLINANGTDWAAYNGSNPMVQTGLSNSIGNNTGEVAVSVEHWYIGVTTSVLANKCIDTGRFVSWSASYIGKTIKNTDTEATAVIVSKDSNDQLTLDADIFTQVGQNFEILTVTLETQVFSYRGIENWYGHIWKFVDGLNVHNSSANGSRAYVCADPADFADDTDTDYELIGNLAEIDGYFKSILDSGKSILPATVGGGSTTYMCDYYYTYFDNGPDVGWRVVLVGGIANHGVLAGAFFVPSYYSSSNASAHIGGRLCKK